MANLSARYVDIPAPSIHKPLPKSIKLAKARKAMRETKTETKTSRNKGGRPRKADADKPWIAANMSRAAWYRKQKARP